MGSRRRVSLPIITIDRAQEAALVESIAHWVRMRDNERIGNEGSTSDHCACCNRWIVLMCEGCPIFEWTGADSCNGTPYMVASCAEDDYGIDSPEFRAAAAAEVTFLESVLAWVRDGKPAR